MSTASYFAANAGKNVYFFRVSLHDRAIRKGQHKVQAWHFAYNTYQDAVSKITADSDVTGYTIASIRLANGAWVINPTNPVEYDITGA